MRFVVLGVVSLVLWWAIPAFVMLDPAWVVNVAPKDRAASLALLLGIFWALSFWDFVRRQGDW
jgi:hypothetical protein